jgi:hypothetical protein
MAKTKVFVSYDYEHDLDMKNNLITESKRPDSPFSINDLSLNEKVPDWQQKAREAIEKCDVFIVLLRENTHQASGVLREVKMAKQLTKRRFQLREKKHCPKPLEGAGDVITWKWKNLKKYLTH